MPAQVNPTIYAYNPDDTIQNVTDARGVITSFSYNSRHLPTNISYTAPSGISPTSPVSFSYDAAGNRTAMTEGSGSISYQYDQVSRLTSETRQFTGLAGSYMLSYSYNLGGELTSLTDPFGAVINYSYDSTGRMTNVTGSSFAGVTQYASNIQYRAWGAIKSASYGDSTTLFASYNSRLQPTEFSITNTLSKHYEYNGDGRLRFTQDQTIANSKFDRAYTYDHVGRVIQALSGAEARAQGQTDDRPYNLSYGYDELNHLVSRVGRIWETPHEADTGSGVYINERNTAWLYDADGRLTNSSVTQYTYDAAGMAVGVVSPDTDVTLRQTQVFDGNGVRTRLMSQQAVYHEQTDTTSTDTKTQYFVTSSVLNQVVTELDQSGQKARTFVYQGGEVLAWQQQSGTTQTISWEHRDPSNASVRGSSVAAELEPMGSNAGVFKGFVIPPPRSQATLEAERTYPFFAATTSGQCVLDGIETPCSMVSSENSAQCPPEGCGPQWNEKKKRYEFFTAVAGFGGYTLSGYMTLGAELDVDTGKWFEHGEETAGGRLNEDINDFLPQQTGQQGGPCDQKLARIFGGKDAVAAGSNYEPKDMPGMRSGQYRGDYIAPNGQLIKGHLQNMMHLYGSSDGRRVTGAYVPSGYSGKPYANPRAYDEIKGGSFVFFYPRLGNLRNVSLVATHIANFNVRNENGRIRIGDIGGPGGDSSSGNPNDPYIHAHFTLVQGRVSANRSLESMKHISFVDAFCK